MLQLTVSEDSRPHSESTGAADRQEEWRTLKDPTWRKRDAEGSLRISPADGTSVGLADGDTAVLTTRGGHATVVVEISQMMRAGTSRSPTAWAQTR